MSETAPERVTSPLRRKRAFALLFGTMVCMGAGQTVLFAILPPAARQLNMSALEMTLIFSISALAWTLTTAYWGLKSDKWGRKPVLLLGQIAFAVSFVLLALTLEFSLRGWLAGFLIFPLLVISRTIYGVLGSGTAPAAQAYVADRTSPQERLNGVASVNAAFGLGTAVGPGIATLFAAVGLLAPFYFVAGLALIVAATIWFYLPERTMPAPPPETKTRVALKFYDRRILPFVIFTVVLSMASAIPIQTMGLFFMDVLHTKPDVTAQFIMIGQMALGMSALFAQMVVVQRFDLSVRQLSSWGCVIAAVGCAMFLLVPTIGALVFALVLVGLGFGMARPGYISTASLVVSPHEQGAVAGLLGAAGAAGFIAAPIFGVMYDVSPFIPYAFGMALLMLLLVYIWLSPTLRNSGVIPDKVAAEEAATTPVANT